MKCARFCVPILMVFLLINLYGCSGAQIQKSAFDDSNIITMEKTQFHQPWGGQGKLHISIYSDNKTPKNKSLATLYIVGNYKSDKTTSVNIKVGADKYKLKPIDENKEFRIGSHTDPMSGITRTSSTDELILVFYIPDEVINKISKLPPFSKKGFIMVNLANNVQIEEPMDYSNLMENTRDFYKLKYPSN